MKKFDNVAEEIVKLQGNFGKLQKLSIEVKSVSDSVLKRLAEVGALSVIPITVAAVYASKRAKRNALEWAKKKEKDHKRRLEFERNKKEQDYNTKVAYLNKKHLDEMKEGKKEWNKTRGKNVLFSATAMSLPSIINLIHRGTDQDVLIKAKYKYGTIVIKVYEASKNEIECGIDKIILEEITKEVSKMQNKFKKYLTFKEDIDLMEFKTYSYNETLIEESLL